VLVVVSPYGTESARWPLSGQPVDLVMVDRVARLALSAQRVGWSVRLLRPSPALLGLLEFAGLGGSVQMQRQAE